MHRFWSFIRRSRRDERGAVTTDWVLLCAALVGMAIVIAGTVGNGGKEHSDRVGSCLTGMSKEAALGKDAAARAQAMKDACNTAAAG